MTHLITWTDLTFRMEAVPLEEMVRAKVMERGGPVESIAIEFRSGEAIVRGKVRKLVPIPFRLRLRSPEVHENIALIPIEGLDLFGIPLPKILALLAPEELVEGRVYLDADIPAVVVSVDAFVPTHVEVQVVGVEFGEEGIVVSCGPGGADVPTDSRPLAQGPIE